MKASDITDEAFVNALNPTGWTNLDDMTDRLGFPWKVVKAKARTMIRKRKTVTGCYCGCRGDFELSKEARKEAEWISSISRLEKLIKDRGRAS